MIPQKCFNTPIKGEVYRYSEDLQLSKQGRWNQFAKITLMQSPFLAVIGRCWRVGKDLTLRTYIEND
jgi:hypothetical protein